MILKSFQTFFQKLAVFSLTIGAIIYFVSRSIPERAGNYSWAALIYFALLTLVFHYGLLKSVQGKPQQFFRYFMAATTIKLALHLMVVVGYSLSFRSNAINFIVVFFALYILFTIFEVRQAIKIRQ